MKYFQPLMDEESLKKRYKRLALIHHPDKGGENGVMQEINQEFSECMEGNGFEISRGAQGISQVATALIYGVLADMAYRKPRIKTTTELAFETLESLKNILNNNN